LLISLFFSRFRRRRRTMSWWLSSSFWYFSSLLMCSLVLRVAFLVVLVHPWDWIPTPPMAWRSCERSTWLSSL
jgi:hypothetical protein